VGQVALKGVSARLTGEFLAHYLDIGNSADGIEENVYRGFF
jgi:hypothetical protein